VLQGWVVVLVSFAYLGLLFAIAYYADKRADQGRSVIAVQEVPEDQVHRYGIVAGEPADLDTPVGPDDTVHVIPAVSGG